MLSSVFLLTACAEDKSKRMNVEYQTENPQKTQTKKKLTEYIIVLNKAAKLDTAIGSLKKYGVQVVRNMKKNRFVISLNNDPGIEQLQKDILNSADIKHIQPNFIYKTQ